MMPNAAVVAERMPVWAALAELFLDSALPPADLERIAAVLAASPYSEEQLEKILRFEITPVLKANLRSVAGTWEGFNAEWLREHLTPRIDQQPLLKFGVSRMIRAPWKEIIGRVASLRGK